MLGRKAAGGLVAIVTLCLAGAIAVVMFVHANAEPDLLWQGYYHDRNGHYSFGCTLRSRSVPAIRSGSSPRSKKRRCGRRCMGWCWPRCC